MTIINPAIQNQTYNCSEAKWFLGNESIVSFSSGNTSFNKENVNGSAYKITWDGGGSGKEHIINNPSNYSYKTGYRHTSSWGVTMQIYKNGVLSSSPFLTIPANTTIYTDCWISSSDTSLPKGWTEISYPNWYTYHQVYSSIKTLNNVSIVDRLVQSDYRAVIAKGLLAGFPAISKRIIVTENNVYYDYAITDTNSIQTIYNAGGIKYTFSGNSTSVQKIVTSEKTVILQCGKDCPPNTCVKCRDGYYVCCYGDQGTVTERVLDLNKEIEVC